MRNAKNSRRHHIVVDASDLPTLDAWPGDTARARGYGGDGTVMVMGPDGTWYPERPARADSDD